MDNKEVQDPKTVEETPKATTAAPEEPKAETKEPASPVEEVAKEVEKTTEPKEEEPVAKAPETPVVKAEAMEAAPKAEPAKETDPNASSDTTVSAIAKSESRDEDVRVKGQEQTSADFTSMFGVASEEQPEAPKANADIPIKLAPVEDTVVKAPEITPEQKKANHQQQFNADEKMIYEIKPEKQGNPVVVVVFFILLVVFILALPKISKNQTLINYFSAGNKKPTAKEEKNEPEFYNLRTAATRAKIGDLEFTNFVVTHEDNEYTLSFTIQNMGELYQFDKKYYIVLYDGEQIVYRALLHSYEGIATKAAGEVTLVINERAYKSANKFKLEEIPVSEYPEVKIQKTQGNYGVLTCKHNFTTIEYYFFDNKLAKIKEVYREDFAENEAYEQHKSYQQKLHKKYEAVPNFDSNFIETGSYFTLVNEFNLAEVPDNALSNLKTYRFFKYNASKDVVNFEIEAQGYECS